MLVYLQLALEELDEDKVDIVEDDTHTHEDSNVKVRHSLIPLSVARNGKRPAIRVSEDVVKHLQVDIHELTHHLTDLVVVHARQRGVAELALVVLDDPGRLSESEADRDLIHL